MNNMCSADHCGPLHSLSDCTCQLQLASAQPLLTMLVAIFVPAFAVLMVGAVIAVACIRRMRRNRQSVAATTSRDRVEMNLLNREEREGLIYPG